MLTIKIVNVGDNPGTIWSVVDSVRIPDLTKAKAIFGIMGRGDDEFEPFDMVELKIKKISVYSYGLLVDYIQAEDDDCEQFYNLTMDQALAQDRRIVELAKLDRVVGDARRERMP